MRNTKQRSLVLEVVNRSDCHPTALEVYQECQKIIPNISLGTVYRNLSFLVENGQILKISTGKGPDHYDGFTDAHNHFVCKCCGKVLDLDYTTDEKIIEKASENFNGEIKGYELQFYGICEECL